MQGKPSLPLPRSARLPWLVLVIGSPICSHLSQVVLVSGISVSLRADTLKRAELLPLRFSPKQERGHLTPLRAEN